jgi:hypothetical protein
MRQSVGKDAADALIRRDRKVAELEAASNGLTVTNADPTRRLVLMLPKNIWLTSRQTNLRRHSLRTE